MLIPRGLNYFFEDVFSKLQTVSFKIMDIYETWGYEALIPPDIDFKSTFNVKEEELFRFLDKFSGKTLVLRPDFTPQIKKYVLFLEEKLYPLRYYYFGNIFRDYKHKRQNFVTGVELIGCNEQEADGEVLSILHLILNLASTSFQVDIGHTLFLEGLFEELEKVLDPESILLLKEIFKRKEITHLEAFVESKKLDSKYKDTINFVLNAYGDLEILKKAKKFALNEKMENALYDLEKVYKVLKNYEIKTNLVFDLSEIRGMDYHKGIIFEAFLTSYPFPIAKGGRYYVKDNIGAVGFTLDLESFLPFVKDIRPKKLKIYVLDNTKEKNLAQKLTSYLREKGYIASRDIIKRDNKISLEIAKKKNWDFAIVLKEKEFNLIPLKGNKREFSRLENLVKSFFKERFYTR